MRAIALRLVAVAAVLLVGLGLAQPTVAHALDAVPVVVDDAQLPAERPADVHGCFTRCVAVAADGLTFFVFSPTDNGFDAIVVAYDAQGRLQASERVDAGGRYFTSVSVDAAERRLLLPGQSTTGVISFDVLDRLALQPRVAIDAPSRVAVGTAVEVRVGVSAEGRSVAGSVVLELRSPDGTVLLDSAPVQAGTATFAVDAGSLQLGTSTLVATFVPASDSPLRGGTGAPATVEVVEQHEVTFVDADGATVAVVRVLDGDAAQAPEAPARPGYDFTGWSGGIGEVRGDLTSTAQYAPRVLEVVLLDDDGPVDVLDVTFGEPYGALPSATREGYDFAGWWTTPVGQDGGEPVDADSVVTIADDHLLFARFTLDEVVATLTLTASAPEVAQGGSATFAAEGFNAAGLPLGDVTADVTLSSDVATDVVDGASVTFPSASPHTITATHVDGATAQVVVEVRAAAVAPGGSTPPSIAPAGPSTGSSSTPTASLPRTGTEPAGLVALGAIVLLGLGLVARRRGA